MVHLFEVIDGVISTIFGYTGGCVADPTYKQVSAGGTGHVEFVEVVLDPQKVRCQTLLDVYWSNVDPFDDGGQFCDRGNHYRSASSLWTMSRKRWPKHRSAGLGNASAVRWRPTFSLPGPFYRAKDYHQDYHKADRRCGPRSCRR